VSDVTTGDLPTEQRNPRTIDIDRLPTDEIVRLINAEELLVPALVAQAVPQMARAVDLVVARLRRGGTMHYFGAGTPARIAVMDAAELVPTYGIAPDLVVAHQAGGPAAGTRAIEGAEDDDAQGERDAQALTSVDVAMGITASGRTPYVAGALRAAARAGAETILVTANPQAPISRHARLTIAVDTGPEVIAGSTRMKAGTAQKLVLNCISTAVMIKLGRTYSNLMATVQQTNDKLSDRAVRILVEATGLGVDQCRSALADAGGDLATALVMLLRQVSADESGELLRQADGSVRQALAIGGDETSGLSNDDGGDRSVSAVRL
jgi:N-acetylmuramic acid 6-phosphate etherase